MVWISSLDRVSGGVNALDMTESFLQEQSSMGANYRLGSRYDRDDYSVEREMRSREIKEHVVVSGFEDLALFSFSFVLL